MLENNVVHFDSELEGETVKWSASNKQLIDSIVELNPNEKPNQAFFHMWQSGVVKFFTSKFKGDIVAIVAHVRTPSPTNKNKVYAIECLNVAKPYPEELEGHRKSFNDFVDIVSQAENITIVRYL